MRYLFTKDCNGHERDNPRAWLVDVYETELRIMKALEKSQVGVGRTGASWLEIMADGNIKYELIKNGKFSELQHENFDERYELISGNY